MSTATVAQLSRIRRIGATRVLRPRREERPAFPRSCVAMPDDHLQQRADVLAARVEALAEALRAGGVPDEAAAQLLSRASAAVLQALNLELLLERPDAPVALAVRLAAA
jgi:ABC-type nitrate/sulfonate/bicarbonate transport system substrate-binding protein